MYSKVIIFGTLSLPIGVGGDFGHFRSSEQHASGCVKFDWQCMTSY